MKNKKYTPSRLLRAFSIRGFRYWDGATVIDKLKPGKKLKLVPEFDNPHDSKAMAIYYKNTKLGFLPRESNRDIALITRYGHDEVFEIRILAVDKEADPGKQVYVGVYVTDNR